MPRKQADAKPTRPKKQAVGGDKLNAAKKRSTAAKKGHERARAAHNTSQGIPHAPATGYCRRPLDELAWPPRHDGIRCHGLHRELPAPGVAADGTKTKLPEITDAKQQAFLATLARTGNITRSCEVAGISRRNYYDWIEADAEFKAARDIALEMYADVIDEEMHARGVDGWDEPQFGRLDRDREGIVGYVRKKSDPVLLRLAAGVRPEKYGKQLHDVRGKDGAPLAGDLSKLTEAELLAYRELVAKMSGGESK